MLFDRNGRAERRIRFRLNLGQTNWEIFDLSAEIPWRRPHRNNIGSFLDLGVPNKIERATCTVCGWNKKLNYKKSIQSLATLKFRVWPFPTSILLTLTFRSAFHQNWDFSKLWPLFMFWFVFRVWSHVSAHCCVLRFINAPLWTRRWNVPRHFQFSSVQALFSISVAASSDGLPVI